MALVVIAIRCANPGTPTGGPRDRKPPVMVSTKPANGAPGFTGAAVAFVFNENVQLTDANTKFVISPPLEKSPRVEAHANTVKVSFNDCELMPSTTYTLDFADCLSDLNEGNVSENFTFTFSTGESTDSMMISGNVYDAQTLTPVKSTYVVLQANTADTAFRTVSPIRIAKTDDYGRFAIKNVPDNKHYRVYALDDQNRNFKFDQPGEMIAWMPDSVFPSMEIRQVNDTIVGDSIAADSTLVHYRTPIVRDSLVYTPDSLTLFAYTEDNYDQYITNDERKERTKISLIFNCRMDEHPRITFPGQDSTVNHSVNEYSLTNDTVTIWLTDSLIYKKDSVVIAAHYPVLDTLNQMVNKSDTLTLWHFEKKTSEKDIKKDNRRKKKEQPKKAEAPSLKLNVGGSLNLYSALSIKSSTPYKSFDWNGVHLFEKVDTLYEPRDYTIVNDTVDLKRKALKHDWQPGNEYKIEIDSAAVYDIYDLPCKAGAYSFKIIELDKYGTLYVDVDSAPANSLLQLVDKKDVVVRQRKVPDNGKVAFRYLKASTYMLRIVVDDNNNDKWDYGNFDEGRMPERLIYYMEEIVVRANWDIKVDFEVGRFTVDKFARKFRVKEKKKVVKRDD